MCYCVCQGIGIWAHGHTCAWVHACMCACVHACMRALLYRIACTCMKVHVYMVYQHICTWAKGYNGTRVNGHKGLGRIRWMPMCCAAPCKHALTTLSCYCNVHAACIVHRGSCALCTLASSIKIHRCSGPALLGPAKSRVYFDVLLYF